jgi:hypothetical protein
MKGLWTDLIDGFRARTDATAAKSENWLEPLASTGEQRRLELELIMEAQRAAADERRIASMMPARPLPPSPGGMMHSEGDVLRARVEELDRRLAEERVERAGESLVLRARVEDLERANAVLRGMLEGLLAGGKGDGQ